MDFAAPFPSRTKKVARRRGTPVQKPHSINVDLNLSDEDNEGSSANSRFSQSEIHAREKERTRQNELRMRQNTKDQLVKSQQEKDRRKRDRREESVEDLTGDSDSPSPQKQKSQKQRSFFDGVRTDKCTNEVAQKKFEEFSKMVTNPDDSLESNEPKQQPKQRKGRGATHQQGSLSNLNNNNGRITNKQRQQHKESNYVKEVQSGRRYRDEDPLDQAQREQWMDKHDSSHVSAPQFRAPSTFTKDYTKKNYTKTMTCNMDSILGGRNQMMLGGGNTTSNRRRKQQREQMEREQREHQAKAAEQRLNERKLWEKQQRKEQQQKEQQIRDEQQRLPRIPRKQRSSSSSFEENTELFRTSPLKDIDVFNAQCDDVNTSFGSTNKRKKRECLADEVEIVPSPSKRRQSKDRVETVTNSDGEEVPVVSKYNPVNLVDEDIIDVPCDNDYTAHTPVHDTHHDDDDGIFGALESCVQPYTQEELERSRTPRGRQTVYDEVQSSYEKEVKNKWRPSDVDVETEKARGGILSLGLTKANNGGNQGRSKGTKKDKAQISMGTAFLRGRDDIVDYDSDNVAAAGKKCRRDSDATKKRLKSCGMAVQTPSPTSNGGGINTRKSRSNRDSDDEWNNPPSGKSKHTAKQRQSTLGLSHSTAGRRKTRSHSKPREGATHENAISIDSDSDESSLGDLADASPANDVELDYPIQGVQTRAARADGDLAVLGVARMAIGGKVLKSNCALKVQFGTKEPYLLFCYSEGKVQHQLRVNLKGDDLQELNYFIADDDENNDSDDNMSIIAFRIKPSKRNGLDKFSEWYDAEERTDNWDKTYITLEIRDKEEFPTMLEQMKMHANLQAFCTNEARLEEYHLPCYNQALLKDNKAERAKRRSGPRSRGRNTTLTSSENKLLVVYPFKVEEEKLQEISSKLTELSGDRLGVAETPVAESDTDDPDDANAEENEVDRNPDSSDTSSRTHYLTIREDDRERLQPGQFLNDTLVDFWMSWISRNKPSSEASNDVHFFTSHFLTTLEDDGVEGVASWTRRKKRNINVFNKKFIFVPVNGDLHWSLCVIVNPGRILDVIHDAGNVSDTEEDEEKEWPCILFLDSLKMHSKFKVAKLIRTWLNFEWKRSMEHAEGFVESPFSTETMKLIAPKVPYQENGCDCGVFVCRYAYNLYTMRDHVFFRSEMVNKFKTLITNGPAFQFGMEDIARIREEFKDLVNSLKKLYLEFKQKEKEQKLEAKKQDNKGAKVNAQADSVMQEEKENSSPQGQDDGETAL